MMKRDILRGALLALFVVTHTQRVEAQNLLDFSGKVALLDGVGPKGVKVKLQVDLDRNRKLESYETVTGSVSNDGTYKLSYKVDLKDVDFKFINFVAKLVTAYQREGFKALLDKGPLPIVISFERDGYSTIVKRLTTLSDLPSLDVVLAPLRDIQCVGKACLSADGSVQISGFPGGTGIARAFAQAYDPGDETQHFPGSFTDDQDNLLKSSGFAEINLHDESGAEVSEVAEPVAVRFEAKRTSFHTMPDLEPGTGRIELPMYSFDRATGEWVREADGILEREDGTPVPEDALPMIRAGTATERVFIAFRTKHFSTFNCDEPIEARACVKGRIVDTEGRALPGIQVSVNGASYTGNAGISFTGADGRFAADVMRSEGTGEDVDFNRQQGETFQARVVATAGGVFTGEAFDTPRKKSSVNQGAGVICRPSDCDCLDLGDIKTEFEMPRACKVTVSVRFSGKHKVGDGGPLIEGDMLVKAKVRGVLSGGVTPPHASVAALCQGEPCNSGVSSAEGTLTFVVPVIGDAPSLKLDADLMVPEGDITHYYSGSAVVAGCTRAETSLASTVPIEVDHAAMEGLGDFIASLGAGPIVARDNPFDLKPPPPPKLGRGCDCRVRDPQASDLWGSALLVTLGLLLAVRRRHP